MSTDVACVELSPNSSRESLSEITSRAAELNAQEKNWKKKSREPTKLSGVEDIELPGAKSVNPNSASATETTMIGSKGVSSLARDARRLKTATLERMGKILKLNSKSGVEKPEGSPTAAGDDSTRKQKFNSLTRMLRLSDKDGQQGNTLTRILRRKSHADGDSQPETNKQSDEQARGIFSRLMGNLRGKNSFSMKNVSSTGSSPQTAKEGQDLSKSASSLSLTEVNLENSCSLVNAQRET